MGAAAAKLLAKNKATIIINYRQNSETANQLAEEIQQTYNTPAIAIKADISNSQEVQEMVNTALNKFNKIDILINNASPKTFPKIIIWFNNNLSLNKPFESNFPNNRFTYLILFKSS